MSDIQWYYAGPQQQRQGPVPTDQLRGLLAQGEVDVDTLVWREGMPTWQALQHVAGELGTGAAPAAAPSVADPYAAPASTAGQSALHAPADNLDQAQRDYADFVGPKYPVYLRKWGMAARGQPASSWNWASFLFGVLWMAYRRMYGVAALWTGALILSSVVEEQLAVSAAVSAVITLGASVAAGVVGNHLYLRHAHRQIAQAKARHPNGGQALRDDLVERGGTRWSAVLIAMLLYTAVVGALVAMMGL